MVILEEYSSGHRGTTREYRGGRVSTFTRPKNISGIQSSKLMKIENLGRLKRHGNSTVGRGPLKGRGPRVMRAANEST